MIARATACDGRVGSTCSRQPNQDFSLPPDNPGLVRGLLDLIQRINPTNLGAENALTDERGDFAEQKEG